MITVQLKGRLGNQLFQYAFAKRLLELFPNETIGLVRGEEYEDKLSPIFLENYTLHPKIKIIDLVKPSFRHRGGRLFTAK